MHTILSINYSLDISSLQRPCELQVHVLGSIFLCSPHFLDVKFEARAVRREFAPAVGPAFVKTLPLNYLWETAGFTLSR